MQKAYQRFLWSLSAALNDCGRFYAKYFWRYAFYRINAFRGLKDQFPALWNCLVYLLFQVTFENVKLTEITLNNFFRWMKDKFVIFCHQFFYIFFRILFILFKKFIVFPGSMLIHGKNARKNYFDDIVADLFFDAWLKSSLPLVVSESFVRHLFPVV